MKLAERLHTFVVKQKCVPWSVGQRFDKWLETDARKLWPAVYQFAHFRRMRDIARPVTRGTAHHFFGYYEKSPWNASGTLLAAHEVDFNDRPPGADDRARIGLVHLADGARFQPLAETRAWNWQQGSMLQWHPADAGRLLLHNDCRDGRFVSVVRDTTGRELQLYERPVYALSSDGRHAYSVNFARLHTHRPGYGYAGAADPWADEPHPRDDGIHRIDLTTGRSELIVSLDALAGLGTSKRMHDAFQWINHAQVSPGGNRLAFFHIARAGKSGWWARLCICGSEGENPMCLLDAEIVSHYDWLDDTHILIWSRETGQAGHFFLVDVLTGIRRVVGDGVLVEDGHATFSPDRKWVLNDTYPDQYDMRTLMVYRWADGKRIDLTRLYSPKSRWWGEIRCDLHPRWNRAGTQVCIDSVHNGERQMYVLDVEALLR